MNSFWKVIVDAIDKNFIEEDHLYIISFIKTVNSGARYELEIFTAISSGYHFYYRLRNFRVYYICTCSRQCHPIALETLSAALTVHNRVHVQRELPILTEF